LKLAWIWVILWGWAAAQTLENPYPKEQASRWVGRQDIAEKVVEGLDAVQPLAILKERPVPFGDLSLAPTVRRTSGRASNWEVPPFPQIGPPGEVQEELGAPGAPAFAAIETNPNAPSQRLRPKAGPRVILTRLSDFRIPEAFSRVCYGSTTQGLIQVSLYGGLNSFQAEDAYVALKAALDRKEDLQGYAEESVLGSFLESEHRDLKEARFESIEVVGKARPEQVDPGLLMAKKAPAFQEISTQPSGASARLDMSSLPRQPLGGEIKAPRSYWVWLGYFPDAAVTAEICLDQRLGDPQKVVDLATLLQTRIRNR
jgi:hypothetical protein